METRQDGDNPGGAPGGPPARIAAFFDVDGTLVAGAAIWQSIWDYHFATRRRRARPVRLFANNLGRWALYKAGMLARDRFIAAWGEGLAAIFAGLTPAEAREMFVWVWENRLRPSLREDVTALLREHRAAGHVVVLVSATLHGLLEVMAGEIGATHAIGSHLELSEGRYTGRMAPPLCFGPHKAGRVRELVARIGPVDLAASFAYADSGHDAALLELVGHPTAVYPDPGLHALARERGWPVLGSAQK